MKALVTGVAGFIGSHLAERLLVEGHDVTGIDNFLDNYPRHFKESNLALFANHARFRFVAEDLLRTDLPQLLGGVDVVFHLAGQPGVRSSWGQEFNRYTENNLMATQLLLEAVKGAKIEKFVYASTSSVYGDTDDLPMREDGLTRPVSPYGATKLAAEHLCYLYCKAYSVPTVALRFFTVYGPRQRPDMFFHILMRKVLRGEEVPLFDDGEQTRDFTFCGDIVEGLVSAASYPGRGDIFNLGGGSRVSVLDAIAVIEKISGRKIKLARYDRQKGDVRHTSARLDHARAQLNYSPRVGLEQGLKAEWDWVSSLSD
ncbi:MAG TPA: NAD-dependent epimerase/dehydratase family protein [Candidatus Binatia bacterium]